MIEHSHLARTAHFSPNDEFGKRSNRSGVCVFEVLCEGEYKIWATNPNRTMCDMHLVMFPPMVKPDTVDSLQCYAPPNDNFGRRMKSVI